MKEADSQRDRIPPAFDRQRPVAGPTSGPGAGPVARQEVRPAGVRVTKVILLLNSLVFLLWWWPGATSFMIENFLVSWPHVASGRLWVLITSVFSHNLLLHLMVNMVVLLSFGAPLEVLMGRRRFLSMYLVAGVVASVAHVLTSRFLVGEPGTPALGASGALAAVLILFAFSFPRAKVLLFFIVPLPAIVAALGFIALDIWGLVAQSGGGGLPIGHGAHLGGALAGIVYWIVRGGALRRRREELTRGGAHTA